MFNLYKEMVVVKMSWAWYMNAIKLSDRYRSKEVFQKSVNVEIPSGRCILFSNELRILKKWWRKIDAL